MAKQVIFGADARDKIRIGIDVACRAIRSTIGPRGRNAFIDNDMQPKITNDGVTIANSITLDDKLENMGAWLVKNTSAQTNEEAGDGTSTTSVLLKAIIDESLKRNENPMEIKRSLMDLEPKITKMIEKASKPVEGNEIENVATVSSESKEIGKLIAEVVNKVGKNVPITIEDNVLPEIDYKIVDGVETKVGYISQAFINKEKEGIAEIEDAYVLACDKKISTVAEIKPFMDMLAAEKISKLVILCADIENSVLGQFVFLKNIGAFSVLIVRVKGAELQDMAAACDATVISETSGIKLEDIKLTHFGRADKITADDKKTVIINESESGKKHADFLRSQAEKTRNHVEKAQLEARANKLAGGVAVVMVGAHTDSEREYQKYKIEDALNATKSAVDEGIVAGGGMCLYEISEGLKGTTIGEQILKKALKEPLRAIIENCGEDYASITRGMEAGKGYDASTNTYVDMFENGIVDPAKVTRCAFQNALSTAANFITAEVAIADTNPKKD